MVGPLKTAYTSFPILQRDDPVRNGPIMEFPGVSQRWDKTAPGMRVEYPRQLETKSAESAKTVKELLGRDRESSRASQLVDAGQVKAASPIASAQQTAGFQRKITEGMVDHLTNDLLFDLNHSRFTGSISRATDRRSSFPSTISERLLARTSCISSRLVVLIRICTR